MRVIITGGNRGIGLGLTAHFLASGAQVDATARQPSQADELQALAAAHPGRLKIAALDVNDDAQVAGWAGKQSGAIDLLINNAGISGPPTGTVDACDFAAGHQVIDTNAFGPLRVARALYPQLCRPGAKVVNISSLMGSIGDNKGGGAYFYRMSKTALNMASQCLALQWAEVGIIVAVVHPGWVQTRMGGAQAPVSVADSVAGIANVTAGLTPQTSGQFFNFDGRILPW